MKKLLIAGIIVAVIGICSPAQQHQNSAEKHDEVSQPSVSPAVVPNPAPVSQESTVIEEGSPKEKHESFLRKAFAPEFFSNWVLVFVGIGAIVSALCTLGAVRGQIVEMQQQRGVMAGQLTQMTAQVTEMGKQTNLIDKSVNVAKESADAAKQNADLALQNIEFLVNRERARLTIRLDDIAMGVTSVPPSQGYITEPTFQVVFYGYTPAFIMESSVVAFVGDLEKPIGKVYTAPILDSNIISQTDKIPINSVTIWPLPILQKNIDAVREGQLFVHLRGRIIYKDAFDRQRKTTFQCRWEEWGLLGIEGRWEKYGKQEDNEET